MSHNDHTRRIAITGFSFRFPGTNTSRLWQDLIDGRNLVTSVDRTRWAQDTFYHPDKNHPGASYTFAAGSLGDITTFDAEFFGISPREAALMDPQQRLLLEMSWEALENSGIKASAIRGSNCGVFIGIASADYSYRLADDLVVINSSVATGNTSSVAANRISYVFDLHGPSMAVDTACSSAMVAFHQACRSIWSGETDQALAGGISLHLHPYGFITFSKASMLSPNGRCRVFDESGDGYVRSEGGGVLLLKDYDQAVADGNPILAVVAHSAVNTDGHKSGLTVPNPMSQAALLKQAYSQAGIDPAKIDYIEAHGTGTAVGDPIETQAIGNALGIKRSKNNPLLIGSIKSNLGHLETASGIAGLAKALYCIKHRTIPATIGLKKPNPNIRFDDWNIKVVTENTALKPSGKLVIGINSFGFGGANAHVILESHQQLQTEPVKQPEPQFLPIVVSAKDRRSLTAATREFSLFLQEQPETSLYDIAHTSLFRREWHEQRLLVFGNATKTIAKALLDYANETSEPPQVTYGVAVPEPSGPVFVYSGNGSQWSGMGQRLLKDEPSFKATIRQIDAIFCRYADYSLEDELAGRNGENRYDHTEIAQPALFALQVGITELLRQRGVAPVAVAGHSVGEVAAAWASGALSLEAAVAVIYHRSRLQGTTKGMGKMTAVGMSREAVRNLLEELGLASSLTIAGINSSRGVTIAGDPIKLDRLESALNKRSVLNKRLDLDYAFHCPVMDDIEADIKQALVALHPKTAQTPYYSTVTGTLLDGTKLDAEYWWHNVRQPVLFEQTVKEIIRNQKANIFIEIGPHAILRGYVHDCLKDASLEGNVIPTILRDDDSPHRLWEALGQTILAGAPINWPRFFPVSGNFVQLPNYSWQREQHWHPITPESLGLLYRRKIHFLLGYPLQHHEFTWENQLDTKLNPTLADHVAGGAVLFPGTGFSELALAAALAWHPGDLAEIEELEIRSPLVLSHDHAMLVRSGIDTRDGSLTIKGRPYAKVENWTLHCSGRILAEPGDMLFRQNTVLELPARQPDFTGVSHEILCHAAGFDYGPAFQCIDYGWTEANSALAVFKTPVAIATELEQAHIHPALLDCTFQLIIQLLKAELDRHDGFAYIPVKMGRLAFRRSEAKPGFARTTIIRRTAHSLMAEFAIFDADGTAIAVVKEARFRSVRLNKGATDHLRYLQYLGVPKPHSATQNSAPVIPFEKIQASIAELSKRAALKGTYRRYSEEVDPLLDILCGQFIRQTLQQLSPDGTTLASTEIPARRAVHPDCRPFLDHLLSLAQNDQMIEATQNGWEIIPERDDQPSAEDIWNSLITDYPDYFQIIHSVGRIGMHLKSLLDGNRTFSQLCPQDSSLTTLTRQLLGAESQQKIGLALRELITQGMNRLPEGNRLCIVEISEGEPSYLTDIADTVDFANCDYIFASPSAAAVEETAQAKERFPDIATHLIDDAPESLEATPAGHIAVVTMDFSTAKQATSALNYARNCLVTHGSIIVIGQHPARWIDFVFGTQPDYWPASTQDAGLSGQRTAQFWQQQLQHNRFADVTLYELSPDTASGPYLLIGRQVERALPSMPAQTLMPRSWIFLADQNGYSGQVSDGLAKQLQARGDMVVQACPGDTAHLESLLKDTTACYGQLDGIVHLAGLHPHSAPSVAESVDRSVFRCTVAANIIQACEATQTDTTCWLVTTDASPHLLPLRAQSEAPSSDAISMDAALWGFGRTLINEASNYVVRLVDLENPVSAETAATALADEFTAPDDEQEIVLSRNGARYAPRLQLAPPPANRETQKQDGELATIRLDFQFPGQLRNLRWQAHPHKTPADDEVEVEVHATGLNFRDVMYALGLLSDEAIENGFSGPTLGLEFSGTVLTVGAGASGFAPGDQVVGFGPSSFGNRVVSKASAISHIPPGISFEAAATIPSTFFTAYYSLHHLAQLKAGEKVLIHGAAGGVGLAAIQLAKWIGAEIYVTAGSDEKRDFLRLLGIEHIHDSRSLAFADEILAQTGGKGVDVVLNSLAGEAINRNLKVLKPFGRFLELGKRDFYENTKIGLRPFRNNISYFGIDADQLMQAQPDLTRRLFVEVMDLFTKGILHPLPYHPFEAEAIVDAFRYMQQARQIGKIVVTYRKGINHIPLTTAASKPLAFVDDASFLVTGGLRGFGLKTAEWLVDKGARHLVLISRSGPSEEAQLAIARMERQGAEIVAAACDVTDQNAIAGLLTDISRSMPPLKGIVHAATVIDDGLVRNMDARQIHNVIAPKVQGAYYLHEMTLNQPLDFFVLFSSATVLFGNPGQANYVAANACLETLANRRRAAGLAATCVHWGAIDDVGFLARNEKIKDALQSRMGGSALNSELALATLEHLLVTDSSGLGVMELDWKALARFLPGSNSLKFSKLARHAGGDEDLNADIDILSALAELSDAELLSTLIEMLKTEVGEVLHIAPNKIDPSRSIYDMGLDSLMGVELATAIENRFGIRLPIMALSQSPTIAKLAERIIEQLRENDQPQAIPEDENLLSQAEHLATQHGVELSSESIADLTREMQSDNTVSIADRIIQ